MICPVVEFVVVVYEFTSVPDGQALETIQNQVVIIYSGDIPFDLV